MSKLTRDMYRPYIDVGQGTEEWLRVNKSTIFELAFNPTTETVGYIDSANDTTELTGYAPTMEQEIILNDNNLMYQFLVGYCMSLPTGTDAYYPVMLTFPDAEGGGTYDAYVWKEASITPGSLNTVDGKLTATLNLNGDVTVGTATFGEAGAVTFAETTE